MKYETSISRNLDYQDVDFTGKIKLTKLLEELSYVAHLNSIKNSFWSEDMMGRYGWVIVKQRIKFHRPITISDGYDLITYPGDYSRVRFYRNSMIMVGDEIAMEQTALWSLIDIKRRRVIRPSKIGINMPEDTKGDVLIDFKDINLTGDFTLTKKVKVEYSHIDINKHLNNVKYLEWCLDSLDMDIIENIMIDEFSLEYIKESQYGEVLDVFMDISDCKYIFKITGESIEDIRFSCILEVR